MNWRHVRGAIAGILSGTCCIGLAYCQDVAKSDRPPNIVLIVADDLGWGDLGCYGHTEVRTPNLDRLAQQGTLFTQYYANSPICSSSRAGMMTGQYPGRLRILYPIVPQHEQNQEWGAPDWLDPKIPTLMGMLQQAGYATGHFGKWHLGGVPASPLPDEYGVDEFATDMSHDPHRHEILPQKIASHYVLGSIRTITDRSLQFIEQHRDRPFYLNVSHLAMHAPLHPTKAMLVPYESHSPAGLPYPGAKTIYYAGIAELDAQVGRLLTRLDELGIGNNTIVIFTSDNGPENIHYPGAAHSGVGSPGPFRGHKASLYEGGIRVPFIVRWPGHVPARRVEKDAILAGFDLLPTLCALAGVKVPAATQAKLDGEDLSGVLLGLVPAQRAPIMWDYRYWYYEGLGAHVINKSPTLAIRDNEWKLLMNPDGSRVELYQLFDDPSEVDNRANEYPEVVERLSRNLLAWKKQMPEGVATTPPDAGLINYPWPGRANAKAVEGDRISQ